MKQAKIIKKTSVKIHGMHCASCEVLIERKLKKVEGIEKVDVNYTNGKAEIYCSQAPTLHELQDAIKGTEYTLTPWNSTHKQAEKQYKNRRKEYIQIGAIFLAVVAIFIILNTFHLIPQGLGISSNMSYGFIFLIGLVASVSSCIAVAGGLLLATATKFNESHPHLSSMERFKPNIYFNIGRVASYTFFGGLIGLLGASIAISPRINGFIIIFASIVMVLLGFQMLNIFPFLRRFQPRMPKFIAHKMQEASGAGTTFAPLLLGASTFFLPCGFTQALILYVLAKGGFATGALTMLVFSLGTLPALLSLGALTSFIKGAFQSYFIKFAAVVVILIGLFNISNGLVLTGISSAIASVLQNPHTQVSAANAVPIVNGKQIVTMAVEGLSYSPSTITLIKGIPVDWHIDGSGAQGCAQVLTVPSLGITQYLEKQGITTISFTPTQVGNIDFSCSMGMARGSFTVVDSGKSVENIISPTSNAVIANTNAISNPNMQKLAMDIPTDKGFYPNNYYQLKQ